MITRRIAAISILLAFVVPLFPMGAAAVDPSLDWTTAIETNQGHTIPYNWESKVETTTFWFQETDDNHGECNDYASNPCITLESLRGGTGESTNYETLYDPVLTNTGAPVDDVSPRDFLYGVLESDMVVYGLEAALTLQSAQTHTAVVEIISGPVGGPYTPVATGANVAMTGLLPSDPYVVGEIPVIGCGINCFDDVYTGTRSYGEQGVRIAEGQMFGVRVRSAFCDVLCDPFQATDTGFYTTLGFSYGDTADPSFVRIQAETASVTTWTEDTGGRITDVFPLGIGVSSDDRAFDLFVGNGNALGDHQLQQDGNGRERYHHHQIKSIRGPDGVDVFGTKFIATNPNPIDSLGTSDTAGVDLFRYRMVYAADTAPGQYRIVVEDRRDDWEYVETIIIGGSGVDIEVVGDSTHSVNPDQPTVFTFDVTNTGAVPTEVSLSLDGLAGGWKVDIQPPVVNAFPGEASQVRMTVTPPAGNAVGDIKQFNVKASAVRDGASDVEQVTVHIVSQLTKGVDVFSRIATLTTGPGVTRETFLGVRNTGSFQEDFILTASGAPAGWQVQINPASLNLFAKSDKSVSMKVTAPPNAVAGTTFVAKIAATSVNDPTIKDVLELPVSISIKDGLDISVLSKESFSDNGQLVYLHRLRDEGPDSNGPIVSLPVTADNALGSFWDGSSGPDNDYDETGMFRIQVKNTGDRPDVVVFEPDWVMSLPGVVDDPDCDGVGVPDGWRFAFVEEDGVQRRGGVAGPVTSAASIGPHSNQNDPDSPDVFALYDPNQPHEFTVPAHSTKYVYAMLAWKSATLTVRSNQVCDWSYQDPSFFTGTAGARRVDPSPVAPVNVVAFSKNDPTIRTQFRLQSEIQYPVVSDDRFGAGFFRQADRGVLIEMDTDEVLEKSILAPAEKADTQGRFRLRATNMANEFDTLRVTVPGALGGWSYDLAIRPTVGIAKPGESAHDSMYASTSGNGDTQIGTARSGDKIAGCTGVFNEGGTRVFECTLGSYDEVAFDLIATPPANAQVGDLNKVKVSVESKDSFQAASREPFVIRGFSEELTIKVVGSFLYDLRSTACPIQEVPACELDIRPGSSVSLPYSIQNKGTAGDDFLIQLSKEPTAQSGWTGDISSVGTVFIPAGHTHHGFLTMRAPAAAAVGTEELFRLKVDSIGGTDTRLVDITANVVAASTQLKIVGAPADYLGIPGQTLDLTVLATRTAGAATSVTFDAKQERLPAGWTLTSGDGSTGLFDSEGLASNTFKVTIPAGEIGNSRVVMPVTATDGTTTAYTELVISLNPDGFGFDLTAPEGAEHLIVSGASVQIPIKVRSNVLGVDTVDLSAAALPAGWKLTFDQIQVPLQPLQQQDVLVTISAPAGLPSGTERVFLIQGKSQGNEAITKSLELLVKTAESVFEVAMADTSERYLAPTETAVFSLTVFNNGTARDDVRLVAGLGPAYQGLVNVSFSKDVFRLDPGASESVVAQVTLPKGIVSFARIPVDFIARSAGELQGSLATTSTVVNVLHHRVLDVDGDLIDEYAIDRDRDASNGFEEFADKNQRDGIFSEAIDMVSFLSQAARDSYTVKSFDANGTEFQVFTFRVDGDGDGRVDFFLDTDADGLPNLYHDPDRGIVSSLTTTKDVTNDGVREYFIDRDGDGFLDGWYDLATGKFGNLIPLDRNNDGIPDAFVVDLDGDGVADTNEPVLILKDGRVVSITEQRDINGDGRLDSVIDEDGDGNPDCFIPAGETRCLAIRLRDVNGDGVEDWTYDSNGDGKADRYYDPVTGKTGTIESGSVFLNSLGRYWYVSALFAVSLVLFVVLVAVTRK